VDYELRSAATAPVLSSNVLTLTDGQTGEAGTVFFNEPQYIGAFYAQFVYQAVSNSDTLGDGACFCLQNDARGLAAVGTVPFTYGVNNNVTPSASVAPSVELCLNLYWPMQSVGYSWNTNGNVRSPLKQSPGSVNIANGDPIAMSLYYDGSNLTLTMVDNGPLATNSFSTNLAQGNLTAPLNSRTAYVGFGGSSGFSFGIYPIGTSTQTISNFTFIPLPTLPKLSISENGSGGADITWPGTFAGFSLLQKSDMVTTNWLNVTNPVTLTSSGNCQATIPASSAAVFYRLAAGLQ
jgi:hypothetical protein